MSSPSPVPISLRLEEALNPEQIAAVTHGEGPQLVLAGAGSGKTRVITYRVAWLIRERRVEPWRIAAVTFTNKASQQMRERVERLAGSSSGVFVGTFHRFALRLLRRYGERVGLARDFAILDTADQLALVKEALEAEKLSETSFPPRAVLSRISGAKNRLLSPDAFEAEAKGFFDTRVAVAYRRYQGLLLKAGGADFDDLIQKAVQLLRSEAELGERLRRRLRYLLVDEFQDTNYAQLQLIEEAGGRGGNLTAVGDEDQSIYRWRGAEIENILRFEQSFPGATVRKLERNYRSTQVILDASGAVVARNAGRRGKVLWTELKGGEPLELYKAGDETDEARWVVAAMQQLHGDYRHRDMAVLVRTNAQTRALEDELLRQKIPYCLVAGVRFYDRAEVKDVIAYLRVIRNPRDSHSLRRILNKPARGIGKGTQDLLLDEAEKLGNSIWDVMQLERFGGVPARGAKALVILRDLILELRREATMRPLPELVERVLERTGYAESYKANDPEDAARLENLKELLSAAQEFAEDFGRAGVPALELAQGADERLMVVAEPEKPTQAAAQAHAQAMLSFEEEPRAKGRAAGGKEHEAGGDEEGGSPFGPGLADELGAGSGEDALTTFLDYVSLVSDTDSLDTELGVSLMTLHSAKGLEFPVIFIGGLEDGLLPHFNSIDTLDDIEEERRLFYVGMTRAERRLFLSTCRRRRVAGRYQDQMESRFLDELPADLVTVHESSSLFEGERTGGVYSYFGRDRERPAVDDPMRGELRKGCRVRHATLGEGVVLELEGEGENARLTVFFQRAGKRKLLARYAPLEVY